MRSMITAPAMTKMMPGMTGMIKPMIPMMIKRVAQHCHSVENNALPHPEIHAV
jgi:hypothetical protein